MSAAVMPMRSTVSAPATRGHAAARQRQHRDQRRAYCLGFSISIASILFRLSMTNFDAIVMQWLCQWGNFFCKLPLRRQVLVIDASAKAPRCLFWHQDCRFGSDFLKSSLELWPMRIRLSTCFAVLALALSAIPAQRRNGGALRHLDGGHSADHRPARSRRRRLSVHRLYDLRSAGGLGDGRGGPARQAGARPRHRMEGRRHRQDQMALHACARA